MKLERLLGDHLLLEGSIHPDLHAAAIAINKKVAEQLKDVSAFIPTEDPKMYRYGWMLGSLHSIPVAMNIDGTVEMDTGNSHKTWPSVEKFLVYLKKRFKKSPIQQFVERLSNRAWGSTMSKDGSMLSIDDWRVEETIQRVGLELPGYTRHDRIVVTPNKVLLVDRNIKDDQLRLILAGKDATEGVRVPNWPLDVIEAFKAYYRQEAKGWINRTKDLNIDNVGQYFELE
jgi:hypothetical protein